MNDERTHSPVSAIDDEPAQEKPSWRDMAAALLAYVERGVPTASDFCEDKLLAHHMIASDLIMREEVKKSCSTCSQPRHDYSYWRVKPAGKLLLAAYEQTKPFLATLSPPVTGFEEPTAPLAGRGRNSIPKSHRAEGVNYVD